jgi:O-antigen ligase
MFFSKISYQLYTAFSLFLVCIVLAIQLHSNLVLAIPFIYLLLPFAFDFCVNRTENLFWLLIVMLPLSTELNITSSLGIDFPDEILMILLTGFVLIKIVHQPKWFPVNLYQEPLFLLLLFMMIWVFISACFANHPLLSFKFFLARIWYIVPFVLLPQILLQTQTRIKKMLLLLLIPMLFIVIQTLLRHASYGFSFVDIKKTINPFFRNHVNYSSMLVCLLAPAIALRYLTDVTNKNRKWITLAIFIGLIGLFFSYSRGSWVALIIGILFAFLMHRNWVKKILILSIAVLFIAGSWLLANYHYMRFAPDHDRTIFHTDFSEHMAATINMKDVSNAERFYRWVAGMRMFVEKPVTGFGPNNFYPSYRPYTLNVFETWVSNNPEHSSVHNYFLLTLAEQGIPGLILLILLWFGMFFRLQYLYNKLQNQYDRIVAITVATMLAMILSINLMSDMIETDKIGSLFWLCVGFVFILNRKLQDERNSIA